VLWEKHTLQPMSSKKTETKKSTKVAEQKSVKNAETKNASEKAFTKPVEQLKRDIRAISVDEWDWDRLIFSTPKKGEFPDGSGAFRRVYLSYRYDEDTMGPAIVSFSDKFCFGVQPDNLDKDGNIRIDKNTNQPKQLRGYKVPLVMTGQTKDEPENITDAQRAEIEFLDTFRQVVIKWAIENKKEIGKGTKKDDIFDELVSNVIFRKLDEDGNVVETSPPIMYTNLIYYSNKKQIDTVFYGPGDKSVDPLTMSSAFNITPNIRFDSVFVGKEISLQHRVYDGVVVPRSSSLQKKRLAPKNTVLVSEETTLEPSKMHPEIVESEDEDEPVQSTKKAKPKQKQVEELESEDEFFDDE